jgi:hypothetical protein
MKPKTSKGLLPNAWTAAGREALAFARQAWAFKDEPRALAPEHVASGDDVVVLLHGLFASAGALEPMRRVLARHRGLHVAAMSYPPGPGIEELSARLAALVDELPGSSRLHLVGHSMGGVVARHYAQTSSDERVAQTISMASPFAGVSLARSLGIQAARDLAPDSRILRELRLDASSFARVPHLSIIAASDAITGSPISHALPGGEVVVLSGRGHNALLFDDEAIGIVERRILSGRKERKPSSIVAP